MTTMRRNVLVKDGLREKLFIGGKPKIKDTVEIRGMPAEQREMLADLMRGSKEFVVEDAFGRITITRWREQ